MPTIHVYHVVQTTWARLITTKTWHNMLMVYCAHNINSCVQKMFSHAHNLLSCAHNSLSRAHQNKNKSCTRNNTCKLWKWTNSSVSLYNSTQTCPCYDIHPGLLGNILIKVNVSLDSKCGVFHNCSSSIFLEWL